MKPPVVWRWMCPLLLVLLAALYFYLMRPDVAGLLYDDGMYLMTAKAMATGHGYRLMGIEGQPYFYKYPPLYPLCLSAIWQLNSHFPTNIFWLKTFNILLSLGVLSLLAYHFRRNLNFSPWISLALVACLGLNWRFIEVSIEMMSEPLFMLLSVGTIILAHRYQHSGKPLTTRHLLWLIALSVASFYTRSMGLVLIVALGLWLGLRGQRKIALIYTLTCGLLLLPWFIWSASKPDTTYAIGDFLVRSFQETYFQSFKMDLHYEYNLIELYSKGMQELLGNLAVQFFPLLEWFFRSKATAFSEAVIMGLSFAGVLFLGSWGYKAIKAKQFSPTGLYVGLYFLILPSWSFFKAYPRFLIVLAPFLLAAVIQAIGAKPWPAKTKKAVMWSFLTIAITTNLIHLGPYLYKPVPNTLLINPYHDVWRDYQLTNRFLREHTPPNAVIYTDNVDESYLYALNSDRTLLDFFLLYPKALLNQQCGEKDLPCVIQHMQQKAEILYQVLQQKHTQYVIYQNFSIIKNPCNNWMLGAKNLPPVYLMQQAHPQALKPLMQTSDGWITIYRFQPQNDHSDLSQKTFP